MTFSNIPFEKYHGLGNDFIFISHRQLTKFKTVAALRNFVVKICQRRLSVGADGVIFFRVLTSPRVLKSPSVSTSLKRIEILIINSDGSFAATCGNALRCLGLKLFREGVWDGKKSLHVFRLTLSQALKKQSELLGADENFALESTKLFATLLKLKPHTLFSEKFKHSNTKHSEENFAIVDVVFEPAKTISYWARQKDIKLNFISHADFYAPPVFVELENPHLIFFSSKFKNFSTENFCEFGQHIQKKMNVNVSMVTVSDEFSSLTLHVYERGAGLTQACGSGAVASALALKFAGIVKTLDTPVELHMPGGAITVFHLNNELILSARAEFAFRGIDSICTQK